MIFAGTDFRKRASLIAIRLGALRQLHARARNSSDRTPPHRESHISVGTMSISAPGTAASARALICSNDSTITCARSLADERHQDSLAVPSRVRRTMALETHLVARH